jgi:predicted small metal-binding protein
MRAVDCDCGEHLEAADDEALARKVQNHMEDAHPDAQQLSTEEASKFVSENAYTSDPEGGGESTARSGGPAP